MSFSNDRNHKYILKYIIYIGIILLFNGLISCVPATDEPITEIVLDTGQPEYRKLINYQDQQKVDSLYPFFNHRNPAYRYMAACAMASIQDKKAIDSLALLLQDPIMRVRTAAAYALGQIGHKDAVSHLLNAFKERDSLDVDNSFNAAILEAIGKTGDLNLLRALATVTTYRKSDTLLLLGQTRAIYRFGLRGLSAPEGTDKMVEYVTQPEFPEEVRLMAANYLARADNLELDDYKFRLAEIYSKDTNPFIRMALATALGKTKDSQMLDILKNHLQLEKDSRVKVNTLRGMANFPYINVVDLMLETIKDEDLSVSSTAADFFLSNGNRNDAVIYKNFIEDTMPWQIQSKMYGAILKHIPLYYSRTKNIIKEDILKKFDASRSPYAKAAYINALGYDPYNYEVINEKGLLSNSYPVKVAAAEGLGNLLRSTNFRAAYRSGYRNKMLEIIDLLKAAISEGDAGVIAIAGSILKDPTLKLNEIIEDYSFISDAMIKLSLPRDIESYNELKAALAFMNGTVYVPEKVDYNNPIDWQSLNNISDSTHVVIKLDKGNIRIKLNPSLTPGTTANFIKLVNLDYYNGKAIHRVVPNFVIQGGGPRGDGYGSESYTIRSELPQKYYDDEGYIGMASAGNHTESVQWFITQSPTPHLDGKYTIFGKVTDGMDVVLNTEIGDRIQDVIISRK